MTGFDVADASTLPPELTDADVAATRLLLKPLPDTEAFQYVWEVPTRSVSGSVSIATLDAATGTIISLEDRTTWDVCEPDSDSVDAGIGYPQRYPTISLQTVYGTDATTRGPDYTHEVHKPSWAYTPDIQIFQYSIYDECPAFGIQHYKLMPMKTIGAYPTLDDYDDIPGRTGTDAIRFSLMAMNTFHSHGWYGWDGNGSEADIVVDSDCIPYPNDNAAFLYGTSFSWGIAPGVVVCLKDAYSYTHAAGLDTMAHEWGHGVVFSSAGWANSGEGAEYHEGFADIIGNMVEWDQQPPGAGVEHADWLTNEDVGYVARRADQDDGSYPDGPYSYHAEDPPPDEPPDEPHYRGFPLAVAHYLLSEGGYNPVCSRLPTLDGCDIEVDGIGVDDASTLMFELLTSYLTSSQGWGNFADVAKFVAFDLFSNCNLKPPGYSATYYQQAVMDAFTAIGYPPSYPTYMTCF